MPFPVAAAIAAGTALAGQGIQMYGAKLNNTKNYERTQKLMDKQMEQNKQMALFNQEQQMKMWEATGPQGQMQQLKLAGLNPGLIYGMGGAGGQTAQAAQAAPVSQGSYHGENVAGGAGIMGLQLASQIQLMQAQKENIQADTANKQAQTQNTSADTINKPKVGANLDADTENKILQQVVTQYAGKEAKDVYERVTAPNREVQAKTYQDELEARQGIAGTIYELWVEGKLKDKSVAEIEQLLLANSKTRQETKNITRQMDLLEENIKGAKLDNIIKDLEARLQTQTGIDKNSNGFLKVAGRLFLELFGNPQTIIK